MCTKSKEKRSKKDKVRSEKKSSKKRRHDEAERIDEHAPVREESPSKRAKTTSKSTADYLKPALERNGGVAPIYEQSASLYLTLSPVSTMFPIPGVCAEHLSPMIMSYFAPLDGVILSYRNIRVSDSPLSSTTDAGPSLAKQIDEYAASAAWVTADFLVLKLKPGVYIDGVLNLQSESHLGLLLWNLYNVSIPRKHLPRGWKWVERSLGELSKSDALASGWDNRAHDQHGHFEDGKGGRLPEQISVRIRDIEAAGGKDGGYLSITATMLSEEQQAEVEAQQAQDQLAQREAVQQTRQRTPAGLTAADEAGVHISLRNGTADSVRKNKHRISY